MLHAAPQRRARRSAAACTALVAVEDVGGAAPVLVGTKPTDKDGRFRIVGVKGRPLRLSATAGQAGQGTVDIPSGFDAAQPQELRVKRD